MLELISKNQNYVQSKIGCIECGGFIIASKHEFVCSHCGLVQNDFYVEENSLKMKKQIHYESNNYITLRYINPNQKKDFNNQICANPLRWQRLAKINNTLNYIERNLLKLKCLLDHTQLFPFTLAQQITIYHKYQKMLIQHPKLHRPQLMTAVLLYYWVIYNCTASFPWSYFFEDLGIRCTPNFIRNYQYQINLIPKISIAKRIKNYIYKHGINLDFTYNELLLYIDQIPFRKIKGKNPRGIAGGYLYILSKWLDRKISQDKLSVLLDVTPCTIRESMRFLLQYLRKV